MKIAGKICPIRSVGKSVLHTNPVVGDYTYPYGLGGAGYANYAGPHIVDNLAFCSSACAWFKENEVDGVVFSEECMAWPTKGDK